MIRTAFPNFSHIKEDLRELPPGTASFKRVGTHILSSLVVMFVISYFMVISVSRLTSVTCVMVVPLRTSMTYAIVVPFTDINNLCHVVPFTDISGIESCGSHGCVCSDNGDMCGFCKFSLLLIFFSSLGFVSSFSDIPLSSDDGFSTYALLFTRREVMFLAMWFVAY